MNSTGICSSRNAYCIYSAIRRGFPLSRMITITKSILQNYAVILILPILNNPKDLDLSYKMDLDFSGRKILCLITEEIWYILLLAPP